jgi:hypothetical protein
MKKTTSLFKIYHNFNLNFSKKNYQIFTNLKDFINTYIQSYPKEKQQPINKKQKEERMQIYPQNKKQIQKSIKINFETLLKYTRRASGL